MALEKTQSDDHLSIAPSRRKDFLAFIKSLRSFKGDLSAITAPPFLLSPISLTEWPSYWPERPSIFVAPASEPDSAKRAVLVLKWYLSTLKQQYGKRDGKKKKPLNPILGELFLGHFEDEAGRTELVSEQVSHHPPVTAYHIWNDTHGVRMYGYNAQKTTFSGTVRIERPGYVIYHLDKYNEDYLMTLPKMHLEGLFPPPPYPELDGKTKIVSSTGYVAEIDYSGKGWLRGKKNSFNAVLYLEGKSEEPLYTVDGQWQAGLFTIRDTKTKSAIETFDTSHTTPRPITVAPVEEQGPLESRKIWQKVANAIEQGDFATVGREKSRIEEEQRALRKTEIIEGTVWQAKYFSKVEKWPQLEELVQKTGFSPDAETSVGMWKWDEEKYLKTKNAVSSE